MLQLNNTQYNKVYVGSQAIKEIYQGSNLLWFRGFVGTPTVITLSENVSNPVVKTLKNIGDETQMDIYHFEYNTVDISNLYVEDENGRICVFDPKDITLTIVRSYNTIQSVYEGDTITYEFNYGGNKDCIDFIVKERSDSCHIIYADGAKLAENNLNFNSYEHSVVVAKETEEEYKYFINVETLTTKAAISVDESTYNLVKIKNIIIDENDVEYEVVNKCIYQDDYCLLLDKIPVGKIIFSIKQSNQ